MDSSDTILTLAFANRIPLGALALILAGLTLAPTGLLMRGVPTAPAHNLEFAAGANTTSWRIGMALAGLSFALWMLFFRPLILMSLSRELNSEVFGAAGMAGNPGKDI